MQEQQLHQRAAKVLQAQRKLRELREAWIIKIKRRALTLKEKKMKSWMKHTRRIEDRDALAKYEEQLENREVAVAELEERCGSGISLCQSFSLHKMEIVRKSCEIRMLQLREMWRQSQALFRWGRGENERSPQSTIDELEDRIGALQGMLNSRAISFRK